ncbi:MAG: endonuclease/exonuclease/phosphatase family protein [Desulfobacterales bacterium]|nr:MAG: endonuclease/exonuclease/phosphatase family protein [Desulfobacterales bacterium]
MSHGNNAHRLRPSKHGFTVLTLNLRFGLAEDGVNSWIHRKKAFPTLFRQHRPDFIGVQEANDFQIDFLKNILSEYDFIGQRSPAPAFWQNNIIFYKKTWKPVRDEHFFLSPTPRIPSRFRESRWPRQCTLGMFQQRRRQLICITTHFDFDPAVQVKSAGIIMGCLSHLPADVPAVLMGDFNASPAQECHLVFTGQNKQYPVRGPSFKNTCPQPFPGTHHGFTGSTRGDHIDWILYRGGIIPDDFLVIRDTFAGIYPSDHFPLWARFKWNDATASTQRL